MITTRATLFLCFIIVGFSLRSQPTISFTFDDGVTGDMPGYPFETWNSMLLDNLDHAGVKAVFFVTGANKTDERGQQLLASWNSRGHKIANHTYDHPNYNSANVTYPQFKIQFLKTDSLIRKYTGYVKLFRFPYLKEGETRAEIDSFRTLMKKHHYRNGHVTIDASDWYIDGRLVKRLRSNPKADIEGFRQFYLQHLYERALYYEDLSFKLTGRHISHTLLLHHNLASALFLDDAIRMFKDKGWKVISAEQAYKDPIFEKQPSNVPGGESLTWGLARESGKFEVKLRYPAEDSRYEQEKMDKLGL